MKYWFGSLLFFVVSPSLFAESARPALLESSPSIAKELGTQKGAARPALRYELPSAGFNTSMWTDRYVVRPYYREGSKYHFDFIAFSGTFTSDYDAEETASGTPLVYRSGENYRYDLKLSSSTYFRPTPAFVASLHQ